MQLTSVIRRVAQVNPKGMATIYKDRQQTWPEFVARVAKLGGALQTLGMKPGDRVAMLALNSDRYLEYFFRCSVGRRGYCADEPALVGAGKCLLN